MTKEQANILAQAAAKARRYARAQYSGFPVGAAIKSESGEVFSGCNIESSSFGLTICAERVALTKALSEGQTSFLAIAIAAKDGILCPPCGACRQLLYDYAPELEVILTDGKNIKIFTLKDLLPNAFDNSQLGQS